MSGLPAVKAVALAVAEFNLGGTLSCGQVFHWVQEGAGHLGMIGEQPVYVEARGGQLVVSAGAEKIARHYFALDHSLEEIYASFPTDPAMSAALEFCRGLRIIRQPLWECVATFITSPMKQVAHIAQISHTLRRRYGKRIVWEGRELFAYPPPEALARLDETDLRACALGYRAKHLLGAARAIATGEINLQAIASMDDAAARAELRRVPGVGEKVANCVLLFGFGRLRAFPIDVWIERVLREAYFKNKRSITTKHLQQFSTDYFGKFGGYAQQYLFHHARMKRRAAK